MVDRQVSDHSFQVTLCPGGERREIESSFREINSKERQQHRDAAKECVKKEFDRCVITIFAAVNFDEQKRRDQAHLVKQKPENKILGGECAVKRGLHHEHE